VPPPSHLTSCTPSKSNLYFDISLATVMRKPALYTLLTFRVPNLMFVFLNLCPLSKESFEVRGLLWHYVRSLFFIARGCKLHVQPPSRRISPCRLSATAYSTYSQLPFKTGGSLLHAVVTKDPPNIDLEDMLLKYIVTYLVIIQDVGFGNWIYCTLYKP
jgi:hypothetical protein